MKEKEDSPLTTIIVGMIFGLPFGGFGLLALYKANELYHSIQFDLKKFCGLLFCGLIFSLIGFGLIISLIKGHYTQKKIALLKSRHPNEPWKHQIDWAKGKIVYQSKGSAIGSWFLTIIWIGMSIPAAFAIPEKIAAGKYLILLVVPLFFVGIYLLYHSIILTLQWYKYGITILRLTTPTGKLGQDFQGVLKGNTDLPASSTLEMTLSNIHQKTVGSGKHKSIQKTILYEETLKEELSHKNLSSGISIRLSIPKDAQITDSQFYDEKIFWQLDVTSDVPGINYKSEFVIPVFS